MKTQKDAAFDAYHTTRAYYPDPKDQFFQVFGMGWKARQPEIDVLKSKIHLLENGFEKVEEDEYQVRTPLPGESVCEHGDPDPLWCWKCNDKKGKNENQ